MYYWECKDESKIIMSSHTTFCTSVCKTPYVVSVVCANKIYNNKIIAQPYCSTVTDTHSAIQVLW